MSSRRNFQLRLNHARSNKNVQPIVKVDTNKVYTSGINDIGFRHLHDIYDTKFIPMIMGTAEIVEENGKKIARFYNVKEVKFYQAWDKSTPDANLGSRQIFTMPLGAFLHAIGL